MGRVPGLLIGAIVTTAFAVFVASPLLYNRRSRLGSFARRHHRAFWLVPATVCGLLSLPAVLEFGAGAPLLPMSLAGAAATCAFIGTVFKAPPEPPESDR